MPSAKATKLKPPAVKRYNVRISRTDTRYLWIGVEADSRPEALRIALEDAGNHSFLEGVSEGEAEYGVVTIREGGPV
jgi:hypothetical protein